MAPFTWGLQPFGTGIISACTELLQVLQTQGFEGLTSDSRWHPLGFAALTLGAVLFGHLSLVLLHTAYRTFKERKKHREFVQLLSASFRTKDYGLDKEPNTAQTTRVLPVDHPLAYCLPAINQPMTVVSQGLLDELSPSQLSAVLTHESAHLNQRHDLLRIAFQAWHKAAPWFPATGVAMQEVTELTEILADDVALHNHAQNDLVAALVHTLSDASDLPTKSQDNGRPEHKIKSSRRIQRLVKPEPPLGRGTVMTIILCAILLVTVPAVISLI